MVAPIGLSGHYHLPVEGFALAREAGINLVFWEPRYTTMTAFFAELTHAQRETIHLLAGTFEAEGRKICNDAERALKSLRVERIEFFLLFWVQSWARINDDVRRALEDLQQAGKIGTYSLSTHVRPLAIEAIQQGWNPVMVRHSAAHRGAESEIFPAACRAGASIITFNNTCYGRLLNADVAGARLKAEDLYRYTLAQPGVTACFSAPRNLEELSAALAVAANPALPPDRLPDLLAAGDRILEEDRQFYRFVRSV